MILRETYRKLRDRYPGLEGLRPEQALFGNRVPWNKNLRYLRYHAECRRKFRQNGGSIPPSAEEAAAHFRREGYSILHPEYPPSLLSTIQSRCEEMVRQGQARISSEENWFLQFPESLTRVPEITQLICLEIVSAVEACFGCHFKIYSSEIYRIIPTPDSPRLSGLWHTDNYPPGIYKIMVYLTECSNASGALGLHPKESTRRLLRRGFFDRFQVEPFRKELETGGTRIEGPAGTVLFWNSNLIHRANPPLTGHRDVVAFKLLPSSEPWSAHLDRTGARVNYESRSEQTPADPSAD